MLIILAAVLAAAAFVVLIRLLWLSAGPGRYTTMVTLAAAVLILGLTVLAATGRLHWLAAVGAAVVPFLRTGLRLLRHLPVLGPLLSVLRRGAAGRPGDGGAQPARRQGPMDRTEALDILGLAAEPTREEILQAHRRLIQRLHPDRGGSKYLAQQLNEAKERLLNEL